MAGNDPTFQITDRTLDPEDPDLVRSAQRTPEALADTAFEWFRRETRRPIALHEWDGPDHTWRVWMLSDADLPIVFQYSGCPDRPADRIIRVDRTNRLSQPLIGCDPNVSAVCSPYPDERPGSEPANCCGVIVSAQRTASQYSLGCEGYDFAVAQNCD